jgi:hypothetical protein
VFFHSFAFLHFAIHLWFCCRVDVISGISPPPQKQKTLMCFIHGWQLNSSINLPLQSLPNGGGSTMSCYEVTGRYIHTYIHTHEERERVKFWEFGILFETFFFFCWVASFISLSLCSLKIMATVFLGLNSFAVQLTHFQILHFTSKEEQWNLALIHILNKLPMWVFLFTFFSLSHRFLVSKFVLVFGFCIHKNSVPF